MDSHGIGSSEAKYEDFVGRAIIYNKIRFYLLLILAIAGMLLTFYAPAENLQLKPLLILLGFATISQLLFSWLLMFAQKHTLSLDLITSVVILELISDIFLFSGAVFISGGIASRVLVLYLFPIMISGSLFSKKISYTTTGLCALFYSATVIIEHSINANGLPNLQSLAQTAFYCSIFFIFAYLSDYLYTLRRRKEADSAQIEMVSLASHQLRTPATAVKGFLSLVLGGELGKLAPQQKRFLVKAYEENELELRLIDNILNVAKIELKNLKARPQQVDLTQLVEEVISEHMQEIIAKDQHVEFKQSEGQEHIITEADYQLLRIVIDNLISNAIKYTGTDGYISVMLKTDKKSVLFSVEDNGRGISKVDRKRLFRRFSRVNDDSADATEGSGLGLYIIKEIVKLHGGKIDLTSYKNIGSIFTITLPKRGKHG